MYIIKDEENTCDDEEPVKKVERRFICLCQMSKIDMIIFDIFSSMLAILVKKNAYYI